MKCGGIFLVLLTSVSLAEAIKVLTTDPSLVLPHRFGQVELLNSSLQAECYTLIGRDPRRYCALIGWDHDTAVNSSLMP